jgi:protein-S-isoprenylcysteine O-methyltransferase Ste14
MKLSNYVSKHWRIPLDKASFIACIYRWRVRFSLAGLISAVLLARPNFHSLLAGMGFCILGLLLRAWACGHLKKDVRLTTTGPYRYTRNPLYLANLIIGLSVVAAARSWWVLGIFSFYFLLFYPVIIKREKEKMEEFFPEKYAEYSKKVPLFFPSVRPFPSVPGISFDWTLYKKNRERRAAVAAVFFWAALTLKMLVF